MANATHSVAALEPIDSRKSFYGKAFVINDNDKMYCKSYETIVAEYDKESDMITIHGYYSQTTARHIRSFCAYVGKEQPTVTQMKDRVSY